MYPTYEEHNIYRKLSIELFQPLSPEARGIFLVFLCIFKFKFNPFQVDQLDTDRGLSAENLPFIDIEKVASEKVEVQVTA